MSDSAGTMIGHQERDAIGLTLVADGFVGIIVAPEWNGATEGLRVVTSAAGGTGVDEYIRMAMDEFIPIGQQVGYISNLGDALSVWCVISSPVAQRVHVEVLPIEVDPLLGDEFVDVIGEPIENFGI